MHYNKEIALYKWTSVGLGLAILLISIFGGTSVVWMRQEIAETASSNTVLEEKLADLDRKNNYLEEQIGKAHNPIYLSGRADEKLRPTHERQVVWMGPEKTQQHLTEEQYTAEVSSTLYYDLAFLEQDGAELSTE